MKIQQRLSHLNHVARLVVVQTGHDAVISGSNLDGGLVGLHLADFIELLDRVANLHVPLQ